MTERLDAVSTSDLRSMVNDELPLLPVGHRSSNVRLPVAALHVSLSLIRYGVRSRERPDPPSNPIPMLQMCDDEIAGRDVAFISLGLKDMRGLYLPHPCFPMALAFHAVDGIGEDRCCHKIKFIDRNHAEDVHSHAPATSLSALMSMW